MRSSIEKVIDLVIEDGIADADKKVHPVEDQWHYPILTKFGFIPLDKTGIGFVRSYRYEHPESKHTIVTTTGYSSDHWSDKTAGDSGYWADLEPHLKKLEQT